MRLPYKKITFSIAFASPADFRFPPAFTFRSIIGYQLRKMCCIARNTDCPACMFHASCVYGSVFESIAEKTNAAAPGRNRLPHPVILETDILEGRLAALELNMIFMGQTLKYLPYFFAALQKGGEAGVLKERIPYAVTRVSAEGASLLDGPEKMDIAGLEPDVWEYRPQEGAPLTGRLLVDILTPLRLKALGRYTPEFSALDFMLCLHRRARILCAAYGAPEDSPECYTYSQKWDITNRRLLWRDYTHYSGRQKKAMRLGGVLGSVTWKESFPYERALLRAALFHAGKNAGFGLGKIEVWEKAGI